MSRFESSTWLAVAVLGVSVYVIYFFSLDLPNSPATDAWGDRTSRWIIGFISIPNTIAPTPLGHVIQQLQHLGNLTQRVSLIGYAGLIVLAIFGIGDSILRLIQAVCRLSNSAGSLTVMSLEPIEHSVFAFGIGATSASLGMLGLGLQGWLSRPLILCLILPAAGWSFGLVCYAVYRRVEKGKVENSFAWLNRNLWSVVRSTPLTIAAGASVALFLFLILLGSLLPATDFDVLTYHLQGPKEYFLNERITFAPHNVYMNMPFGTEMLSLLSMIVVGDWWWGGLVGQTVLASFAPMTAIGIAQLGKRCFGNTAAGWLGALIYLTTPWVYRISIIPLTENALAFYLLAALLAGHRALTNSARRTNLADWVLTGFLAGSAAGCKYTAFISTVTPVLLGTLLLMTIQRRRLFSDPRPKLPASQHPQSMLGLAAVALGIAIALAPWLIRNAVWTGNPTYPLLYRLLGGRNWSAEKNEKWEWGHRVALLVALGVQRPPADRVCHPQDPQHSIELEQFLDHLKDVVVQSDWLSPLLFSLAPLALIGRRGRRAARWLWLLVGFLFWQWWLLTHRNDRFWTAMLPVVSVLAGGGCVWTNKTSWRWFLIFLFPPIIWFNLSFSSTSLCGYNQFGVELIPRRHPFDVTDHWLNDHLPPTARVLAIGESAFFHQDRAIVYNSVFDDSIFLQWTEGRLPAQILDELRRHKITHVFVNWAAIEHHRAPTGYGFPAEITPRLFRQFQDQGILRQLPFDVADVAEPVTVAEQIVAPRTIYEVIWKD